MSMFDLTVNNTTLSSRPWKQGLTYWSSFELYPDWKGKHHYVFKGAAYHQYEYETQVDVVVKTPRDVEADLQLWQPYIRCAAESRKLANLFNEKLASQGCDYKIVFLTPSTVVMDDISDIMVLTRFFKNFSKKFSKNEVVLFEDHLDGDFLTYVTESGHACFNGTGVLDAFCHFTYHHTGGEMVVCNLKGIQEDNNYYFTNPVIHSVDGLYGPKDQGEAGIADFFKHHMCTGICSSFCKPTIIEPSAPPPSYEESMLAS